MTCVKPYLSILLSGAVIVVACLASSAHKTMIHYRAANALRSQSASLHTKEGTVTLQWCPVNDAENYFTSARLCCLRIKLKFTRVRTDTAALHYMEFRIMKYFHAVICNDTMLPVAYERIPGLDPSDYCYMACFCLPASNGNYSFPGIWINDSVAGFAVFFSPIHATEKQKAFIINSK